MSQPRADKLNEIEPGDVILNTKAGPVLIRKNRYYSMNEIRSWLGEPSKYELRYELRRKDEFEYFGLSKEGDT